MLLRVWGHGSVESRICFSLID